MTVGLTSSIFGNSNNLSPSKIKGNLYVPLPLIVRLVSTTLNSIEIKLNDELTIIDTPGILNNGDFSNYIDIKTLKKVTPKKEIKPITYQIKNPQSIFIEDLVRVDLKDLNSVTLYLSNALKVDRIFNPRDKLFNLEKYEFDIKDNQDIVISGLGFFKFVKKC